MVQGDNRILDEALAIIGEAVKLDNEKKYPEALSKYMLGVDRLIHVIRCACRLHAAGGHGHGPPYVSAISLHVEPLAR